MLIKNTSEIIRSVRLNLEYDDGTVKSKILSVGDSLELVFRRNCEKQTYVGIITNIGERVHSPIGKRAYQIAYIEFDYSEDFHARKLKIDLCDIIDFSEVDLPGSGCNCGCDCNKKEDTLPDGSKIYTNIALKVWATDDSDPTVVGKSSIALGHVDPEPVSIENYPVVVSKTREIISADETVKTTSDSNDGVVIVETTHNVIGTTSTAGVPVQSAGYNNYIDSAVDRQSAIGSSYGNTRY